MQQSIKIGVTCSKTQIFNILATFRTLAGLEIKVCAPKCNSFDEIYDSQ